MGVVVSRGGIQPPLENVFHRVFFAREERFRVFHCVPDVSSIPRPLTSGWIVFSVTHLSSAVLKALTDLASFTFSGSAFQLRTALTVKKWSLISCFAGGL